MASALVTTTAVIAAVGGPARAATLTVGLFMPPNDPRYGAPTGMYVVLSDEPSGGTVTFLADGSPVSGCTGLAATISAIHCPAVLDAGSYSVQAMFSGSATMDPASSSVETLQIMPALTSLAYTAATTATPGLAMPVSAELASGPFAGGPPITGQEVTFAFPTGLSCTATTDSGGVAACTLTAPGADATLTISFAGAANYSPRSTTADISISQLDTTTTVSSLGGVWASPVTITATVAPSDGTGTVTFRRDGSVLLGCETVSLVPGGGSAAATCTVPGLPAGSNTVTADFSGAGAYLPSTGTTIVEIGPAPSVLTYTGPPVVSVGAFVALSASLTDGNGRAFSGETLTFEWAGSTCEALVGSGGDGSCTLRAEHTSDSGDISVTFAGSTQVQPAATVGQITVEPAPTVTLVSAPPTATAGVPVELAALVGPSDGAGVLAFTANDVPIVGCEAVAAAPRQDGTATAVCPSARLPGGTVSVRAAFSGSADYRPSSGAATVAVAVAPTSLAYSGDTTAVVGQTARVAAALTDTAAGAVPVEGAELRFSWGSDSCAATTDASGAASCALPVTAVAQSGAVDVSFAGNTDHAPAQTTGTIDVEPATTATTVTGPATAPFGESVDFVAVVAPSNGAGTVAFTADGVPLPGCDAVATALAGGQWAATCTALLPAGDVVVTAAFSGGTDYLGSAGDTTITVTPAPTLLVLTGDTDGAVGEAVTLAARLTATPNGGTAVVGTTVQFMLADLTCTAVTDAAGIASCEVTPSNIGQGGELNANFGGTPQYAPAAVEGRVTLAAGATVTNVEGPATATYSVVVTFVATVVPAEADGTVTFSADDAPIGGCEAVALVQEEGAWQARCSTSALEPGDRDVRAAFTGTPSYNASVSEPITVSITPAPTSLAYSGSLSGTVGAPLAVSAMLSLDGDTSRSNASLFAMQQQGVPDQQVEFHLGDTSCTAMTDAMGAAACELTPTVAAASGALQVTYAGSATYRAATIAVTLTINQVPPTPDTPPPSTDPTNPPSPQEPMVPTPQAPDTPELPATGTDTSALVLAAGALLALGVVGRRAVRRTTRPTPRHVVATN